VAISAFNLDSSYVHNTLNFRTAVYIGAEFQGAAFTFIIIAFDIITANPFHYDNFTFNLIASSVHTLHRLPNANHFNSSFQSGLIL